MKPTGAKFVQTISLVNHFVIYVLTGQFLQLYTGKKKHCTNTCYA